MLDVFGNWDSTKEAIEGPKNAPTIMHRTSFYNMYHNLLTADDRKFFENNVEKILKALNRNSDDSVFKKAYLYYSSGDEYPLTVNKLTIGQFLYSIVKGIKVPDMIKTKKK